MIEPSISYDYTRGDIIKVKPDSIENGNPTLQADGGFDLSYKIGDFCDPKEESRFIKAIKTILRKSPEYAIWRKYIIETLNEDYCFITHESKKDCRIEIHHHPISLERIIHAIIEKRMIKMQEFTTFEIAEEAMKLHYEDKIGYIPLITSIHEKFHAGSLDIPIDLVHGDWKCLLNEYTWDDDDIELFKNYSEITKSNVSWIKGKYPGNQPEGD